MKKFLKYLLPITLLFPCAIALTNVANKVDAVKAETTPTIHVMSCNLDVAGGSNSTKNAMVLSRIREADPDLIGVQEENAGWYSALTNGLYDYTHIMEYRGGSVAPGEASGIFFRTARFHLIGSGTFWLGPNDNEWTKGSVASSWGASFARVCSFVVLNDLETGRDLGFFNAHYEYSHDGNTSARVNSSLQVARHIKQLGLPCFFTGDCNFWREYEPGAIEAFTDDDLMIDSYKYMETRGGDTGFTFHAYGGHDEDVATLHPNSPIDYNLCTKGDFIPTTFHIYDEDQEYGIGQDASYYYSDHYFISTVYQYDGTYPGKGDRYISTYNLEAEFGDISGTSSDAQGAPMIGTRSTSNSRPTSNGTCVFNFATANNSVTWRFKTNKATNNVPMTLWFAPSDTAGGSTSGHLSITLNGEEVGWKTTTLPTIPDYNHWYNWSALELENVTIPKGNVEIVLTNKTGKPGNFDNLEIDFNNTLSITDYKEEYAYIEVECESKVPDEGTCGDPSEGWVCYNSACSRGACIGNWNNGDTWTDYHFDSSAAVTGATITLYASNYSGNTNPNGGGGIWVSVNGVQKYFDETSWSSISGGYYVWQALHISNLSLNKGDNVFHIENWTEPHNLDRFVVTASDITTLTYDDPLEDLTNNYLHMNDYEENKGWCKDDTHHYYQSAKTKYNSLNDYDKDIFSKVSDFAPAKERLTAWATANGDVLMYSPSLGTYFIEKDHVNEFAYGNDTALIIAVVNAFIGLTTVTILLAIRKRKKHQK